MTINAPAVSKINWTNGLAFVVSVLAVFGVAIPAEWQENIIQLVAVGTPVITMVFRTFFTNKDA